MRRTLLTLAIAIFIAGVTANAHHSFAAYYFENQSTTIEGEVQEFQLRSPHALLLFKARTPEGRVETYTAEWGNPRRLNEAGVTQGHAEAGRRGGHHRQSRTQSRRTQGASQGDSPPGRRVGLRHRRRRATRS